MDQIVWGVCDSCLASFLSFSSPKVRACSSIMSMATSQILPVDWSDVNQEDLVSPEFKEFISSLPRDQGWNWRYLYQYEKFWCLPVTLQGVINFQRSFKARDEDVFLATFPKSGTTWLKALGFAIVNRGRYAYTQHSLLTSNPHHLVPWVETKHLTNHESDSLTNLVSPRLLGTHLPYLSLPASIKGLDCRIVYVCRNPKDTFISLWKFINNLRPKSQAPIPIEEAFELFCRGTCFFGPFWDHVLGYWNESLKSPERVLFLKYEDMKDDTIDVLKKIGDFLGCPFSLEEERQGKVEEILRLCSFENLRNLEVNKTGIFMPGVKNDTFFRKGEVGDWANYFTPPMTEKLNWVIEEKLQGSGLSF
eukprot:TRINITY_DN2955_c0_g2_i1.p1 TRINITY_DN2955_c0_g2~~TRINITY_DN2955_c0_g2_i1.p1  ORF type:complete len:363 (+),score=36.59 TRINITY_DN2955_c0_g2_i1:79-1167(+)